MLIIINFMNFNKSHSIWSRSATAWVLIGAAMSGGTGCGSGSRKIAGLENFSVGVLQKNLLVSFMTTAVNWDVGASFKIPGLLNSTLGIAPDLSGKGTVFQFVVPLSDLMEGQTFPSMGLPDGRPIPDIKGGALPRWDVPISNGPNGMTLSVYLSDEAFGIFAPIPLKVLAQVSVKIEDERGNLLGKAYAIPLNVSGSGSGLFILLPYLGGAPQSAGHFGQALKQ